jgi:Toxin SymE, type I toxin-antitoxin system
MADNQSSGESTSHAVCISDPNPTISASPPPRRLKVVPKSRHSRLRGRSLPCAPTLIFGGRWLQRAGFDVGSHVHIVVSEGRLVIERANVARRLYSGIFCRVRPTCF